MHWFQFPQIPELMSLTVTSFLWQCYLFSVHSVLFIILKIVLLLCLNKELCLWWILSYLVSLIGGLDNEQSLTSFYWWQINTYIYTNLFKQSKRSRFVVTHYKSLNLFCTYTIWLFTAFVQINIVAVNKLYL